MKCPYNKITTYSKKVRGRRFCDATLRYETYTENVPCSEYEAHTKTEEFADCLKNECAAYGTRKGGGPQVCLRINGGAV